MFYYHGINPDYGSVELRIIGSNIESEGFLQARCGQGVTDWAYFNTGHLRWSSVSGAIACSMLGYDRFAYASKRDVTETDVFPVVNRELDCKYRMNDLFLCPYMVIGAKPEDGRYAWLSCGFGNGYSSLLILSFYQEETIGFH